MADRFAVVCLWALLLCHSFTHAAPFFRSNLESEDFLSLSVQKRQFATFGPHLSMGQTDSEYVKLTTTFQPGMPPKDMTGSLFIWPGFFDQKNRSEGDLVQTVAEFHEEKTMKLTCNAAPGQWYV
jgi:hypothetical protein